MQFDPETVSVTMWQGMTEDEYRNAEPYDYKVEDEPYSDELMDEETERSPL